MKPYYEHASITLYLGDSMDILPTLEAESLDAIVTDPPYMLGAASARKSADKAIGWADINNASYWYAGWFKECWRILKDTGCLWIFANWRSLPVIQCAASKVPGMSIISVLVWDKEWPSVGSTRGLRQHYELVVLFGKPKFSIESRSVPDIWREKWTSHKPTGHPQEKPVELVGRLLVESGIPEGGLIADPFAGSCTTGIAAKRMGLRCVLVEMGEEHCAAGAKRLDAEAGLPMQVPAERVSQDSSLF